jgi:hypothetical protein
MTDVTHASDEDLVWLAIRTAKDNDIQRRIRIKINEEVKKMLKKKKEISNSEISNYIEKRFQEEYDKVQTAQKAEDLDKETAILGHLGECFHCKYRYEIIVNG